MGLDRSFTDRHGSSIIVCVSDLLCFLVILTEALVNDEPGVMMPGDCFTIEV